MKKETAQPIEDSYTAASNIFFMIRFSLSFLIVFLCYTKSSAYQYESYSVEDLVELSDSFRHLNPDSSLTVLAQALELTYAERDTINAIRILGKDNLINGNLGRYNAAYERVWQMILLADQAGLEEQLISAYLQLGRHYGYSKKRAKAFEYFNLAQQIIRCRIEAGDGSSSDLIPVYFSKSAFCIEIEEFEQAEQYLDTCFLIGIEGETSYTRLIIYHNQANILIAKNKCLEAATLIDSIITEMGSQYPEQLIMPYASMGDAQRCISNYNIAIDYYQRSIDYAIELNSHLDYSVTVYEKLSEIYELQGDYQMALSISKKADSLDFLIFDSRSKNNADLFAIQDKLRLFKAEQNTNIQRERLANLEHQKKSNNLKIWALLTGIFVLTVLAYLIHISQKERQVVQRKLNQELQDKIVREEEYSAKIDEKNNRLVVFTNVMTHDLKSPLRTIKSFSDLIQLRAESEHISESTLRYLKFISDSAKRMAVLIDDLFNYSKLDTKDIKLRPVDLNHLVDDVIPFFTFDLEQNNAEINSSKLPTVKGNVDVLKTVFQNIISNGLKYQQKSDNDHHPVINIWSQSNIETHDVFIEDNGIGIPEEYQDKIFEPFDRYHTANEYEGTGLGLSFCERILRKHDGELTLYKSSSEGSIFKLTFPN